MEELVILGFDLQEFIIVVRPSQGDEQMSDKFTRAIDDEYPVALETALNMGHRTRSLTRS